MADNYRRSQAKGKLHKGPLFNKAPMGIYKLQIQEKLTQLEESAKTILLQNLQITTLNDEFNAALVDFLLGIESVGAWEWLGFIIAI